MNAFIMSSLCRSNRDLSHEHYYTFNDLIIVLIYFVAGFKNTDFLFFTGPTIF